MKSLIAFIAIAVLGMISALLIYLGAFKPVTITVSEAGPYRLVFKHHTGAYHKIVPDIEVAERWAVKNGEACETSFGEYIDDPNLVDEDRLNSNGGCVVKNAWTGSLPDELQYREVEKRLYVIAEFDGAPSIGPQKVYPKATKFIAKAGYRMDGPVIEMYERRPLQQLRTQYHFPVRKN